MVFGAAVDDKMLDAGIVLRGDALQGSFEGRFCVVCYGCYGKERLHAMPDRVLCIVVQHVSRRKHWQPCGVLLPAYRG